MLFGRKHSWTHPEGPYRRVCEHCGRRDYLGYKRFPAVGEPAIDWMFSDQPCSKEEPLEDLMKTKPRWYYGTSPLWWFTVVLSIVDVPLVAYIASLYHWPAPFNITLAVLVVFLILLFRVRF